jgi:membrane-bound serine protease (ClpP class)
MAIIIHARNVEPHCAYVCPDGQLSYNETGFPHRGRMEFLLDPNIAYLLLVVGMLFAWGAVITPGTGVPELLAVFSLVLAGYAVYHLSFNWWALALLMLSWGPFFYAVRGPRREAWLALSIIGLTLGSSFFFPTKSGLISVHPALAAITTLLYSVFLWISVRKVAEISRQRPAHELSSLIGQKGEARTAVLEDGSVQVAGELWSARSEQSLTAGSPIRVIGRDGFVLKVQLDEYP